MNSEPILGFQGPYRFLSNFYPSPIIYAPPGSHTSVLWPTVEHAYQASKTFDGAWQITIWRATHPAEAKRLGAVISKRLDLLRPDWRDASLEVMAELLMLKFSIPQLATALRATGQRELVEVNTWGDTFWGVCKGVGENWLGRLLMVTREII